MSDLHFGRVDAPIAEALAAELHALRPSLVVVSGDFTQRARAGQYRLAREFLQRLPRPQLVVPGNHDVPLYDVLRRFLSPLTRYVHYITPDLRPVYQDEELLVLGINTARSLTWKGGRISREQLLEAAQRLGGAPPETFKVMVTHHPFLPAPGEPPTDIVGRAREALEVFERQGVDLLLSGHLHLAYSGDVRGFHPTTKRSMIAVHAGTATSNRRRGEPNEYNVIRVNPPGNVSIEARSWDGVGFSKVVKTHYSRQEQEWVREDES
jgi:3',5'-cyclic AMP phosphodiesterase CpdA